MLWYAVWFVVGAAFSLSFISFIGVITLPITAVVIVLLCLRPGPRAGAIAALAGAGMPFLYVAWLNRTGPGTSCRTFAGGGSECVERMSPLPWLAIGVLLLV